MRSWKLLHREGKTCSAPNDEFQSTKHQKDDLVNALEKVGLDSGGMAQVLRERLTEHLNDLKNTYKDQTKLYTNEEIPFELGA